MKLIRNALSFFLCAALLASSVFCVSAEDEELTTEVKFNLRENWARLIDIIPEDCRPYYSDILNLERDDMAFMEITDIEQCSESNGIFVTLKGCPYEIIGVETPNGGFGYEERCNAFLRAMILDRKTGEPVAFDMFNDRSPSPYYSPGLMPIPLLGYRVFFETNNTAGSIQEARVFIELPDYFNNYDYKLVLFLYLCDIYLYRVEENGNEWLVQKDESITEPVEADLSGTTLCMDANGDDIINISDVSAVLKHIAEWETDNFNSHRADVNHDGKINIEDADIILKYLAEWDSEKATSGYYMDKYINKYHNDFTKKKVEDLKIKAKSYGLYLTSNNKDKSAEEWEADLQNFIYNFRDYYSFEEVEKCFTIEYDVIRFISEANTWKKSDLISFLKSAYYSE